MKKAGIKSMGVAERRNYGPETLGKIATNSEKENTSIDDMGKQRFNFAAFHNMVPRRHQVEGFRIVKIGSITAHST